jgi:hypothetical protein
MKRLANLCTSTNLQEIIMVSNFVKKERKKENGKAKSYWENDKMKI